jgi:hypothetical protein
VIKQTPENNQEFFFSKKLHLEKMSSLVDELSEFLIQNQTDREIKILKSAEM